MKLKHSLYPPGWLRSENFSIKGQTKIKWDGGGHCGVVWGIRGRVGQLQVLGNFKCGAVLGSVGQCGSVYVSVRQCGECMAVWCNVGEILGKRRKVLCNVG